MSSFIVSNQTLIRILRGIYRIDINNFSSHGKEHKILSEYKYESPDKILRKLLRLNIRATNERYETPYLSSKEEKERIKNLIFHLPLSDDSKQERNELELLCASLKSLHCFLYQCYEGNVPKSKTYKQLTIISNILKDKIINELPEYKTAGWGD